MSKLNAHLSLIRWQNLLIMAVILVLLRYGFLVPLNFETVLSPLWHAVLILTTVIIAAGGNAVNDAYDVNADLINKPDRVIISKILTKDDGLFFGQALLLSGAILGLVLGYFNQQLTFSYIFPLSALLLWLYAKDLKRRPFIGNLIIAFLGALMVFNEAIFDLLSTLKTEERDIQIQAVYVVMAIAGFSFLLTLIRELIKDLQDIAGDRKAGYKTLPITSGTLFPKILSIFLLMFATVAVAWIFWQTATAKDWLSSAYILIFVIAPMLLTLVRIAPATQPEAFKKISLFLKMIMLTGVFSILVFTLSFKMNWAG